MNQQIEIRTSENAVLYMKDILLARRANLNRCGRPIRRASSCESCICGEHEFCQGECRCREINHESSRLAFEGAKLT